MTNQTKTEIDDAAIRADRPEAARAGRARLGALAAAVATPLVLWAFAELVVGIDLRAPASPGRANFDIGPALTAAAAAVASLAGWGLLATLERATAHARNVWLTVALVALMASLGGPLSGSGITAVNRAVLVLMHLAVGAALIPTLFRSSPPPAR